MRHYDEGGRVCDVPRGGCVCARNGAVARVVDANEGTGGGVVRLIHWPLRHIAYASESVPGVNRVWVGVTMTERF